jgi:hypothetical protein
MPAPLPTLALCPAPSVEPVPALPLYQQIAQTPQRIGFTGATAGFAERLQRYVDAFEQRADQLGFVLKVPVDSAACNASRRGNVSQGGA